jgi:RNA polymerase sigma-70 factor (subfamily 1)
MLEARLGKPKPNETPRDWLAAARQGEVAAIAQVLESLRTYLLLIAEQELPAELRPKLGASDLVQQSLAKAHQNFGQFAGESPEELKAWLRQILLNCLIDAQRGQRAQKRASREKSLGDTSFRRRVEGALVDAGVTPMTQVQNDETAAALEAALGLLSPDYQRVIRLRYQEARSFADIAQEMGRSESAVQKLWTRALRELRKKLAE